MNYFDFFYNFSWVYSLRKGNILKHKDLKTVSTQMTSSAFFFPSFMFISQIVLSQKKKLKTSPFSQILLFVLYMKLMLIILKGVKKGHFLDNGLNEQIQIYFNIEMLIFPNLQTSILKKIAKCVKLLHNFVFHY